MDQSLLFITTILFTAPKTNGKKIYLYFRVNSYQTSPPLCDYDCKISLDAVKNKTECKHLQICFDMYLVENGTKTACICCLTWSALFISQCLFWILTFLQHLLQTFHRWKVLLGQVDTLSWEWRGHPPKFHSFRSWERHLFVKHMTPKRRLERGTLCFWNTTFSCSSCFSRCPNLWVVEQMS